MVDELLAGRRDELRRRPRTEPAVRAAQCRQNFPLARGPQPVRRVARRPIGRPRLPRLGEQPPRVGGVDLVNRVGLGGLPRFRVVGLDRAGRVEVDRPWFLSKIAEKVRGRLTQAVTLLLEKK